MGVKYLGCAPSSFHHTRRFISQGAVGCSEDRYFLKLFPDILGPTKASFVKKISTRGRSLHSGQGEGFLTESENVLELEVPVGRKVHAEREEEDDPTKGPQQARQEIQMVE